MTDQLVARVARIMVLVLTLGAVLFAIYSSASLVSLYLLGSAGVAQFFPGVVLGLFSKRVTTSAVFAGMAIGISVTAVLMLTGRDPYYGLNAGLIALGFNFVTTGLVSLLAPRRAARRDETVTEFAASQTGDEASHS